MPPAFHAMAASLVTGLFFFTLILVAVRTVMTWRDARPDSRLAVATDVASWWAALIGTAIILAAMLTGIFIWAPSSIINSPVMRNKILAAILLLVTMTVFLVIRRVLGPRLWQNKVTATFYALVALAGFHWSMVTNSIGGDVAGIPSGYETIVRLSGVETRFTYYLPTWALIVIAALSVALLVLAFLGGDRKTSNKPAPKVAT